MRRTNTDITKNNTSFYVFLSKGYTKKLVLPPADDNDPRVYTKSTLGEGRLNTGVPKSTPLKVKISFTNLKIIRCSEFLLYFCVLLTSSFRVKMPYCLIIWSLYDSEKLAKFILLFFKELAIRQL